MLLGPSRWFDETGHPALDRTPFEIRCALARFLDELGVDTVLMEDEVKDPGQTHFDLFLRLVEERQVSTFVIFWPIGARLHGLEVEVGYLLSSLSKGTLSPDAVYLLAEERALGLDGRSSTVAWSEPGNRTRYHEDLVAHGCPIRRWSDRASLFAQAAAIGLERGR